MQTHDAPRPLPHEAADMPLAIDAQAVLDQLHPLQVPPVPAWSPQAPGWTVLAAVALTALAVLAWRTFRRWRAGRHRRAALAELQRLRASMRDPALRLAAARAIPALVRRLALAHAPRAEVAALHGADWHAWLDRSLGDPARPFSSGVGRSLGEVLGDWAYRPAETLPWELLEPSLDLVERWIRTHRVEHDAGGPGRRG